MQVIRKFTVAKTTHTLKVISCFETQHHWQLKDQIQSNQMRILLHVAKPCYHGNIHDAELATQILTLFTECVSRNI